MNRTLIAVVAAVALFLGGGAIGRFTTPVKIVELKTHTSETIKLQTIEQKVDVAELAKLVQDIIAKQQKDVHTKKTVQTNADGSSLVTEETIDKSTSETSSHTASEVSKIDKSVTNATLLDQKLIIDQSFKSVERVSQNNWALGVFAGYQVLGSAPSFNLVPKYERLVAGLSLDYRLLGPFWLGGFFTTTGILGVSTHFGW